MKLLIDKYKENILTPTELQALRDKTRNVGDEELEQLLLSDWVASEKESPIGDRIDMDQMKKSINSKLDTENKLTKRLPLYTILRYTAVLLIPLLVFSTFYFYRKADAISNLDIVVSVGEGERMSLALPDGTSVKMNAESELRYNPADFNISNRTIRFEGEGYFEVTSNRKIPFVIESQHINLKVLGTTFNFLSREQLNNIEVTLLKGHVLLSASGKSQELFAHETAIFNKETGEFKILKDEKEKEVYWIRHEIYFKNSSFSEVLSTLEREYNIQFKLVNAEAFSDDTFSGILPSADIETVMEILKKSYGFNYTINSDIITLEVANRL